MCHYFIKALEDSGKLLRNYTQNIDTLEQVAGIKRIVQCHGIFLFRNKSCNSDKCLSISLHVANDGWTLL